MTVHTHKSKMRVYACVQTRYMYMQTHTKAYLGWCTVPYVMVIIMVAINMHI